MKNLFVLLMLFTTMFSYSQVMESVYPPNDSIGIVAIDGIGNTDTVWFGFNRKATVGIDTFLGERNVYNQPYSDLDLRFIQRTETHVQDADTFWLPGQYDRGCSVHHVKPFLSNSDSKIDYRARSPYFDNHFVLEVYGEHFPITVALAENKSGMVDIPFCVHSSQDVELSSVDVSDMKVGDTIVHIKNSQQLCLLVFRPWVILSAPPQVEETVFNLFPNPASASISITYSGNTLFNEVFAIDGTKLESFTSFGGKHELDVTDYLSGVYFIRNKLGIYKFIKTDF